MPYKITNLYSPNFDTKKRRKKDIDFIILHYTGMKKEFSSIKRLTSQSSKVSCHYFIKSNGDLIIMVPEKYIAWHAGVSKWKNFKSLNKNSIGIEISNPGHSNNYRSFSKAQIKTLIDLLKKIKQRYKIKKQNILGHSDIAPDRKKDPGEKFPWYLLARSKLSIWPNLKLKSLKKFRNQKIYQEDKAKFLKNIYKIGYCKITKMSEKNSTKYLTRAFQRRFRNELVDGNIDFECFLISKNLANK